MSCLDMAFSTYEYQLYIYSYLLFNKFMKVLFLPTLYLLKNLLVELCTTSQNKYNSTKVIKFCD